MQVTRHNTIEKDQGVKPPLMALQRDLLLDFRHRPNAIFSNIASFALKAAGGDDWLKKNIHHETPCFSFQLNEGQHVCTPESTMYDPYSKTARGLLRNKTEVHTAILPTNRMH